jgi:3',5'-cyclic AMP phosphodiesterase CpdA
VTLRLAHLSDIHFGGENAEAVAAATAWVNAGAFDLIVVSGDLTRYAEIPEFEAASAWLAGLNGPKLVTPGNHDAPYLAWAERIVTPFRRYERAIGAVDAQSHLGDGLAVRGLNTARGAQPRLNWSKGQLSRGQVRAAVDWFATVPQDAFRIVVCHHPLTEMLGGPMTARVWGGPSGAATFAEAKVDLVLSGHIHAPFTWPYPCGDGRTYAIGAGTLSIRERGVPPGFNVIEIEDDAVRVVALGWRGSHFEPLRTWSLERRV